jgi:hypothetical protein
MPRSYFYSCVNNVNDNYFSFPVSSTSHKIETYSYESPAAVAAGLISNCSDFDKDAKTCSASETCRYFYGPNKCVPKS